MVAHHVNPRESVRPGQALSTRAILKEQWTLTASREEQESRCNVTAHPGRLSTLPVYAGNFSAAGGHLSRESEEGADASPEAERCEHFPIFRC